MMEGNPQAVCEDSEKNNSICVRMSRTTHGGRKKPEPCMCVNKTKTSEEMESWESGVNGDHPPTLCVRKSELASGVDVG